MKKLISTGAFAALVAGAAVFASQDGTSADKPTTVTCEDMGQMAPPTEQHKWLKRFVGEWESQVTIMQPGQENIETTGSETIRSIGDFWVVSDTRGSFSGQPFSAAITLGYDPEKQKYIGTWIDSMTSYMWTYEGTVDEAGDTLTLRTEGKMPNGSMCQFREVHQFKNDDHRVFTSSMQGPDGTWNTMLTVDYRRK